MQPEEREKQRAASVSLAYNVALTLLKIIAAVLTGSVSLLSEAAHSGTDVVSSAVSFVSVRAAAEPPDEDHPYGHGKIESLAGFGEAVSLLILMAYVAFESIQRLFLPHRFEHLDLGMGVMLISSLTAVLVSRYVSAVGKKTGSLALLSNAQHLNVDSWTSLGIFLGLGISKITGWIYTDSVVGLIMAAYILKGAWKMTVVGFEQLIDRRLSDTELAVVTAVLTAESEIISFHRLRSRLSGSMRYIDFHVVVPRDWTVVQAHEVADRIEEEIEIALAPAQVVVHVDPFDPAKVKA